MLYYKVVGAMEKLKPFIIIALIGVALGVCLAFLTCRGCDNRDNHATQPIGKIPPGWVAPPVETTTPWPHKPGNRADEVLTPFPPGSRVVEVDGEQVCAILPSGDIITPEGVNAVVYRKPPRSIAFELRPWVGCGVAGTLTSIRPVGAAGIDVLRIKRFHIGPGACVDSRAISGLLVASCNPWRNVDVCAGGGYGTAGACAFVGVGLGVQ